MTIVALALRKPLSHRRRPNQAPKGQSQDQNLRQVELPSLLLKKLQCILEVLVKEHVVANPKGKAKCKTTKAGKKVCYGQAGKTKDGKRRVQPGTNKGDAYCARSMGQMKKHPKAAKDPNSPLRLSRKRWKCKGAKSTK